jgi:hypothetical protein
MYSNNEEYRATIREYFKMDVKDREMTYEYLKESDPESYDEMLYDDAAMKKGMDDILEKTKDNRLFQQLYLLAAGKFLSEDAEIGLCVLLTYDYFADFCNLLENPTSHELFMQLKTKLE